MKSLQHLGLWLAILCTRVARGLVRPFKGRRGVAMIEVTRHSYGSLGDEAMMRALADQLHRRGDGPTGIICHAPGSNWADVDHAWHLGSFSGATGKLRVVWRLGGLSRLYALGADVIDGVYGSAMTQRISVLLTAAHRLGVETTLCGFSVSESPNARSIELLGHLSAFTRLCARDPVSQQRLAARIGRPIDLTADMAFLMQPAGADRPAVAEVASWCGDQHDAGRLVIGVNLNRMLTDKHPHLVDAHVAAFDRLNRDRPIALLVCPHDSREGVDDRVPGVRLLEALPDPLREHSRALPDDIRAHEVKAVCGHLDLSVTGRMHFAIANLGMATPVVCITYQGKFQGLLEGHFGLADCTIEPAAACDADALASVIGRALESRASLADRIRERLEPVRALSALNVEPAGPSG